ESKASSGESYINIRKINLATLFIFGCKTASKNFESEKRTQTTALWYCAFCNVSNFAGDLWLRQCFLLMFQTVLQFIYPVTLGTSTELATLWPHESDHKSVALAPGAISINLAR